MQLIHGVIVNEGVHLALQNGQNVYCSEPVMHLYHGGRTHNSFFITNLVEMHCKSNEFQTPLLSVAPLFLREILIVMSFVYSQRPIKHLTSLI